MKTWADFGARAKELRLASGRSLRVFCLELGVSVMRWSLMEMGVCPPLGPIVVAGIAECLGLDTEADKEILMDLYEEVKANETVCHETATELANKAGPGGH